MNNYHKFPAGGGSLWYQRFAQDHRAVAGRRGGGVDGTGECVRSVQARRENLRGAWGRRKKWGVPTAGGRALERFGILVWRICLWWRFVLSGKGQRRPIHGNNKKPCQSVSRHIPASNRSEASYRKQCNGIVDLFHIEVGCGLSVAGGRHG